MVAVIKESTALSRCEEKVYTHSDGRTKASFYSTTLHSNFQPIFSLSHRRPIGYEGLLRVTGSDNQPIPPMDAFNSVQSEPHIIELDRLSRYIHVKNYKQQLDGHSWLFLNVHPTALMYSNKYGRFIGDLLFEFDVEPTNVVIEILEDSIHDNGLLNETIQYYRELGCLVAIDDFGTGNSNFDRVWQIEPDIVKLDKSIINDLKGNKVVARMLPNLVSLIHECGSLVLLEGIENEEQALIAVDSGADFVQGYYLAKPAKDLLTDVTSESLGAGGLDLSNLCSAYQSRINQYESNRAKILRTYTEAFGNVSDTIQQSGEFTDSLENFLSLSGVERCYMLNRRGHQIGVNLFPDDHAELFPQRFSTLEDQANASWYRRSYFRKAINEPAQIHVSRPYLSMTAGIVCITLSVFIKSFSGKEMVLCCDIDWSDR